MKILLKGANHQTAPIQLREQLAIEPAKLAELTRSLLCVPGVREGMILSTCNRLEMIVCHDGTPNLLQFLSDYSGIEEASLEGFTYDYQGIDAVQHLYRVASSLDSLVIGEPQILGQMKEAYTVARSIGAVRSHLDQLLQAAFSVAKKVRSETRIGRSSVSVASVAVDLASKVIGSLSGKRIMLVGAGKMSEMVAAQLIRQGADPILIANRTYENALSLTDRFGGRAIRFEDLYQETAECDIVIASTNSQEPIYLREHGLDLMRSRRNKPMCFIDLAVPRNVDPAMKRVEGIVLYDIDSLQEVASFHLEERNREAQQAEMIVAQEAIRYHRHTEALNVGPMIRKLQAMADDLRQSELRRARSKFQSLSNDQQIKIEALTRGLMNKFLHPVISNLKDAAEQRDLGAIERISTVFNLPADEVFPAEEADREYAGPFPTREFNVFAAG